MWVIVCLCESFVATYFFIHFNLQFLFSSFLHFFVQLHWSEIKSFFFIQIYVAHKGDRKQYHYNINEGIGTMKAIQSFHSVHSHFHFIISSILPQINLKWMRKFCALNLVFEFSFIYILQFSRRWAMSIIKARSIRMIYWYYASYLHLNTQDLFIIFVQNIKINKYKKNPIRINWIKKTQCLF